MLSPVPHWEPHPFCTVFLAHALHNLQWSRWPIWQKRPWLRRCLHVLLPLFILVFPPYSILAAFWKPLTILLRLPVTILTASSSSSSPPGPLGKGYAKLCTLFAADALWRLAQRYHLHAPQQHPIQIIHMERLLRVSSTTTTTPPPDYDYTLMAVVILLSVQVNCVLGIWGQLMDGGALHNSNKNRMRITLLKQHNSSHQPLHQFSSSSRPAVITVKLSFRQHLYLLLLALINAICEEAESRGFWRTLYQHAAQLTPHQSNIAQALFFGLWHYNGIPSGWSGVVLTFVYGMIMGYLQDLTHGSLGLPIVAHTLTDYYIFVHVARKQVMEVQQQQQQQQQQQAMGGGATIATTATKSRKSSRNGTAATTDSSKKDTDNTNNTGAVIIHTTTEQEQQGKWNGIDKTTGTNLLVVNGSSYSNGHGNGTSSSSSGQQQQHSIMPLYSPFASTASPANSVSSTSSLPHQQQQAFYQQPFPQQQQYPYQPPTPPSPYQQSQQLYTTGSYNINGSTSSSTPKYGRQ